MIYITIRRSLNAGVSALFFIIAAATTFSDSPVFYGIGQLPGGAKNSEIRDAILASSGIFAVGNAQQNPASAQSDEAVIWTPTGGLQELPSLNAVAVPTTGRLETAAQISTGTNVIAARISTDATGNDVLPALYNADGTLNVIIGLPAGVKYGAANGVAANGKTVFGFEIDSAGNLQGFVWTLASGVVQLPEIAGYSSLLPAPRGCSNDGSVDVGAAATASGVMYGPGSAAFEFNTSSGISLLPLATGGTWAGAAAIDPSGTYVLGCGDTPANPKGEVLLWTSSGVTPLGVPLAEAATGMQESFGGVTRDGAVVVAPGVLGSYLHNSYGWFDLQAALTDGGADLTGWTVLNVLGMNSDGTLVFGQGQHGGGLEGFVAQLPSGYLAKFGKPSKKS